MGYDDYVVPDSTRCPYCNGDGRCYAEKDITDGIVRTFSDDEVDEWERLPVEAQGVCDCPECDGRGYI